MRLFRRIFAAAASVAVAGCMSSGTEVKQEQLADLQKGKTTYAEVVSKFGPPNSSTVTSEGAKIISYVHTETQAKAATFIPIVGAFAGGATGKMTNVTMTFDSSGVLQNYTAGQTSTDVNN
ncbi:hypothetical protein GCM10011611_02900 [Aliidongia dinghuensis]|uniref:Beta-barrel assembly machine subunit BamE n=1 Tax=Aliidongia dinghuensis TaxID=1867774 RepID=A0A8J2YPC7_9PROT|nr:hypothetical protein [Aliidongia dinghuensis]GGF00723.1 hypothetical protein GCM10011611_02900 [Aliidongia dinghuensis]